MYLTREANTGPLRVLPARALRPPQMRSTIRCGTPSEAGGHAPSKRVGVVPIVVDGVGVGLAIDQRPARVWDPKDVPEGEHRQRSLNQEQAKESQPGRFGGAKATGHHGYQCSSEAIGARCVAVPELLRVEEGPCIRGDELPLWKPATGKQPQPRVLAQARLLDDHAAVPERARRR